MTLITAVLHETSCPMGLLGRVWQEVGVRVRTVDAWADPLPADPGDALVVMGGTMGACDDADAPWLAPTRELIATSVHAGVPFLGVCLGHQLATVALGGSIRRSDHLTLGLTPMSLTDAGRDDALLAPLGAASTIHYNNDVAATLPEGAVLLAEDPTGQVEAVRFADRAWGVQFHPECTAEIFDAWTVGHGIDGWDQRLGWQDAVRRAEQVRAADPLPWARGFALAFLDQLA